MSDHFFRMKDVIFCAHDNLETSVEYDGFRWFLHNKIGLFIEYDNLQRALGDLYAVTGIMADDFTILQKFQEGL